MKNRIDSDSVGLDGDWDVVLMGRGCSPPTVELPPRPIRINFTDAEIEKKLMQHQLGFRIVAAPVSK